MSENHYDELYKVVLVGDPGVGKTNMLAFFTSEAKVTETESAVKSFNPTIKSTIGVEFGTRIVQHPNGKKIKAQIWDTAGQERYRAITSSHYRRAAGALLVYDVSSPSTFTNAQKHWLKELKESAGEGSGLLTCIMLVGNKIDLPSSKQIVSHEEHTRIASELSLLNCRTSAKTGVNVEEAFTDLIIAIYDNGHKSTDSNGVNLNEESKPASSDCCV